MPRLLPGLVAATILVFSSAIELESWGGDSARCRKSVAGNEKLCPH